MVCNGAESADLRRNRIRSLFTMSMNPLPQTAQERNWYPSAGPVLNPDGEDVRFGRDGDRWSANQVGGGRRDRTDDLMLAKHALSQLSYAPNCDRDNSEDENTHSAEEEWWAWEDSNFRPHAYQARALTN